MRFYTVLPLTAALATAIVLPDEQVMNNIAIENNHHTGYFSDLKNSFKDTVDKSKSAVDSAIEDASKAANDIFDYVDEKESEAQQWFEDFNHAHREDYDYISHELSDEALHQHWNDLKAGAREWYDDMGLEQPKHHRGPPVRGGPDKFRRPYGDEPRSPFPPSPPGPGEEEDYHHKKPGHKKPHCHKPNQTVYELINKSKYSTKFAKLVNKFPDIVEKLNSTNANVTIFVPTDKAFEKIPHHGKEPPKEFLEAIIAYHVVRDVYPAGKVFGARTLATALAGKGLSSSPEKTPQRISVNLGLKGLSINFYSRVVAINIFGTNGVVHGIDSILVPPPKAAKIIQFLPGEFSTLELGLVKTGLFSALNDTSNHLGGTIFAPSNTAWQKLGPKATGFLFSKYGRKYLKALLEYHVVPDITLYSDAIYYGGHKKDASEDISIQRTFHVDLPTLLKDKYLSVDVAHFSRFLDIRINGFNHVAVTDGITKDGVIQVPGSVIIPPKSPLGDAEFVEEEIDVDDLKARLEPFVNHDDDSTSDFEEEDQYPLEL